MEYSFKNKAKGEATTLFLDDYSCTVRRGSNKEVISYATFVSVRISKSYDHTCRIHLSIQDHSTIVIPSRSFSEDGAPVDQSAGYSLFVRVLHHHLKDKSDAVFRSGGSVERIWQQAGISAVLSFIISFTANYWGFTLINPVVQAVILAVLATVMVLLLSAKKMPKTYKPTDIPLQFLP